MHHPRLDTLEKFDSASIHRGRLGLAALAVTACRACSQQKQFLILILAVVHGVAIDSTRCSLRSNCLSVVTINSLFFLKCFSLEGECMDMWLVSTWASSCLCLLGGGQSGPEGGYWS
jgi:hypothetical protein